MARTRRDPDAPRAYPWTELLVWAVLAPMFLRTWADRQTLSFWPPVTIAVCTVALAVHFYTVRGYNRRLEARLAGRALPSPPVPEPAPTRPLLGGASADTPSPLVPESLRPLVEEASRVADALVASGRGRVAESLEEGIREAIRLTHLRAQIGPLQDALAEAREEAASLAERAAGATDAEARLTWTTSAEAAARRVEKLESLRTTDERADARIASFRQLVKSLAVDLARKDLTEIEEAPGLADLADQAGRVDREVEALHSTHAELRTVSAARRAQGA